MNSKCNKTFTILDILDYSLLSPTISESNEVTRYRITSLTVILYLARTFYSCVYNLSQLSRLLLEKWDTVSGLSLYLFVFNSNSCQLHSLFCSCFDRFNTEDVIGRTPDDKSTNSSLKIPYFPRIPWRKLHSISNYNVIWQWHQRWRRQTVTWVCGDQIYARCLFYHDVIEGCQLQIGLYLLL